MLNREAQKEGLTDKDIQEGMAATYGVGSDAYPATVVEVKRDAEGRVKAITIQEDRTAVSGVALVVAQQNGLPEPRGAKISVPDSEGRKITFTRRKNGQMVQKGFSMKSPCGYLSLGRRRFYQDPHI